MDNKTDLRVHAKIIRKGLDIPSVSSSILNMIRENKTYQNAQNVMIFYPMKYEINLLPLLEDDKNFYLPKVYDEDILVCPFKFGDVLVTSHFKVQEPCSNPVNPEILDLIFVPALMADKDGFRLGYGGGFYDRFLAKYKGIKTILPISSALLVEKLPRESFDRKADIVISC